MRIALYTKTWRNSGTGLFAKELVQGLATLGAEVDYIAPKLEIEEAPLSSGGLVKRRETPREHFGGTSIAGKFRSLRRCLEGGWQIILARRRTSYFIITSPDPIPFLIINMIFLRLSGAKVIYIVHDPEPHKWLLPANLVWLEKLGLWFTYKLASVSVVLSTAGKNRMIAMFPGIGRVEIIPHGVFPTVISEPTPRNKVLLVFGTIRENKGVAQAIKAVVRCREDGLDVRLVIAGEPHQSDLQYFEKCQLLALGNEDGISITGSYVSDLDLVELLKECDALLTPYTEFYSQSGVGILAACNARPLISSRAGGLGDLIDIGMPVQVISDPLDVRSIARAITEYYDTEPDFWQLQCQRFTPVVLEALSWTSLAARYISLSEEL